MTDYYVDTSGNNSAAGTSTGAAWRTLSKLKSAIEDGTVGAGDTVYLRGGTWQELCQIYGSGTDGNPITITNYPSETPIIDGKWNRNNEPNHDNEIVGGGWQPLVDIQGDYIHFVGITVKRSAGRGIRVSGPLSGSTPTGCTGNRVQNCTITDCFGNGIRFFSHRVNDPVTDFIISGNTLTYCAVERKWGGSRHPTILAVGDYCVGGEVYDNTVAISGGEALNLVQSSDIDCYDNLVYDCESTGGYIVNCHNITFRNNLIYHTGSDYKSVFGTEGGRLGITVRDEPQYMIGQWPVSSDNEIYNNIVVGSGIKGGIEFANKANMIRTSISHNTIVGCQSVFTFYGQPKTNFKYTKDGKTYYLNWKWEDVTIENNVFVGPTGSISSHSELTWRYNNWDRTPPSAARSTNNGDIYADPQLVDEDAALFTASNYHLTASSPGIGEARKSGVVVTDYLGASRGSSPDMGAHQYDGEVSPVVSAAFTASDSTPAAGDTVTFTDGSSVTAGAIDDWSWEVSADGGQNWTEFSTSQNPTRDFDTVGDFVVRLTVQDVSEGLSDSTSRQITVSGGASNPDPTSSGNLITDGDFASGGTSNWTKVTGGNWTVTDGELKLTNWSSSGRIYQAGISLTSGSVYTLKFDTRVEGGVSDEDFTVEVVDNATGSTDILEPQAVTVPNQSEMETFTYTLTAASTEADSRLQFRITQFGAAQTVYIDNVSLRLDGDITAGITISDSGPDIGDTITISDNTTATNGVFTWLWELSTNGGDTYIEYSDAESFSWIVPDEGVYTWRLTVTGVDGTDSTTGTVTVSEWRDSFQRGMRRGTRWGMM